MREYSDRRNGKSNGSQEGVGDREDEKRETEMIVSCYPCDLTIDATSPVKRISSFPPFHRLPP